MARKSSAATASTITAAVEEALQGVKQPEELDDEAFDKLAEFTAMGGKDYKVRVELFSQQEKKWEIVETFPLDGFDPFESIKHFGGGRYRLTLLNERGKYVEGGRAEVRIASVVKPAGTPAPSSASAPAAAEDPSKSPMLLLVIESLRAQSAQTNDLLKAVLTNKPAETSKQPTLPELITAVKGLKDLNPQEKSSSMKETLELLSLSREIFGGEGKEAITGTGFFAELREAYQAAKEIGLIEDFKARLRASRGAGPAALPGQQPAAAAALPAPVMTGGTLMAPAAVVQPRQEAPVPQSDPIAAGVRPYIAIFKAKAENQVDPATAAESLEAELYENIVPLIKKYNMQARYVPDDTVIDYLVGQAKQPQLLEQIFAFAPDLAPHRPWVLKVVELAIARFEAPPEA